ncbi:MAG: tyrosine-type recombinase/integrase [Pseudomonadota bacterium]
MQTQLSEFTGIRNAAIISVLMGCGLRVSGVSRLNESDLVYDTDENGKESAYLRVVEKGNNQRAVPLPDESFLFIRAYLGHPELDKIDRSLPNGDRVLFVNIRNPKVKNFDNCGDLRRLSTSGIRRMVYNLGQQAGLPKECCHPHALRHLYGTELVEAGTDTLTVQTLMGHKDANSTKVYIHLSTRRLRKAVDKGNPLGKMKTQVSGLTHLLHR